MSELIVHVPDIITDGVNLSNGLEAQNTALLEAQFGLALNWAFAIHDGGWSPAAEAMYRPVF